MRISVGKPVLARRHEHIPGAGAQLSRHVGSIRPGPESSGKRTVALMAPLTPWEFSCLGCFPAFMSRGPGRLSYGYELMG